MIKKNGGVTLLTRMPPSDLKASNLYAQDATLGTICHDEGRGFTRMAGSLSVNGTRAFLNANAALVFEFLYLPRATLFDRLFCTKIHFPLGWYQPGVGT